MSIYKQDIADVELESGTISRTFMNKTIGRGDNLANRFGVRLFRNGVPVSTDDVAVEGFFISPIGTNILITGTDEQGNALTGKHDNIAWVQLPQACYNEEGRFTLAIKISNGTTVGTVRFVDGVVDNTGSSGAVAPTDTVPTYQEIIAVYDEMVDALRLANNSIIGQAIAVSSQTALEAKGVYADANTIPVETVIAYYLSGDAVLAHAPDVPYKGGARAIVITLSCRDRSSEYKNGTVQLWYDRTIGNIYHRTCFESTDTWSDWTDDTANAGTGLTTTYDLTNNQSLNTKRSLKAGVPVYFTADAALTGKTERLYFDVYGFYNGTSNYDKLIEYGSFNGKPICVIPTRDYDTVNITVSNATITGSYSAWISISTSEDKTPAIYDAIDNANKNAGVLKRYSAKALQICKMHDLEGLQGDVLTVRAVKTSNSKTTITVYGLYGKKLNDGYDTLGTVAIGSRKDFQLSRNYGNFQTYIAAESSDDTVEFEVDAAVNLENGVQKDVDALAAFKSLNQRTCNIFHKVVCIGDSYTSGHIQAPGESTATGTNENYAWPHFMEQLTGNTYVNCGISGATTITWQTGARGLQKATSAGLVQAYIIGLMINDSGTEGGQVRVPVGSISDIGTENQTYYAQLSKIVREVNAISPTAKIFINTCPMDNQERYGPYNEAVRDIVEAYKTTYPVHCVDLASDYYALYDAKSLTDDFCNSHYTALGYEQFAEIYAYILSDYINKHISDFQNVYKIPYDS